MRASRISVSVGFAIMLGLLIYLDGGTLFWAAVSAAALHELGHYAAMRMLGGQLQALRLTAAGAEMVMGASRTVSYSSELIITLAGPVNNLVCALLCANLPESVELRYLFAGVHLSLGCFNILPIYPLDGGSVVRIGLTMLLGDQRGYRVSHWISVALSGGLFTLGVVLFLVSKTQISLLVTSFWLLARNLVNR